MSPRLLLIYLCFRATSTDCTKAPLSNKRTTNSTTEQARFVMQKKPFHRITSFSYKLLVVTNCKTADFEELFYSAFYSTQQTF